MTSSEVDKLKERIKESKYAYIDVDSGEEIPHPTTILKNGPLKYNKRGRYCLKNTNLQSTEPIYDIENFGHIIILKLKTNDYNPDQEYIYIPYERIYNIIIQHGD